MSLGIFVCCQKPIGRHVMPPCLFRFPPFAVCDFWSVSSSFCTFKGWVALWGLGLFGGVAIGEGFALESFCMQTPDFRDIVLCIADKPLRAFAAWISRAITGTQKWGASPDRCERTQIDNARGSCINHCQERQKHSDCQSWLSERSQARRY